MEKKFYAGIGSRETPPNILYIMKSFATLAEEAGYILRSGAAMGADSAFESGVKDVSNAQIFIPGDWFGTPKPHYISGVTNEALKLAQSHHGAWYRCSYGAKKLHARNMYQVLGKSLDEPVDFIICWTPGGREIGGTASAIKVAKSYNIPIINLGIEDVLNGVLDLLENKSNIKELL